ncbi:MAG: fasciclin domain-containing protein [Cyclobacteriaceae bacterium]
MKNLRITLIALVTGTLLLASCGEDDPVIEQPTQNIVEIAQANGFTSLAAALTKAGLVDALQANGSFTVFAPTNEAFDGLLAAIGQTSIDDVPASVLEQVLLYHVIDSKVLSTQISDGSVATLGGATVDLSTIGGIKVNTANVSGAYDVEATNGVIHTIDAVLVPPAVGQFVNTVLTPAYFNENFTTLIAAAVKADVVGTLLNTPNLTIFAPTNEAFQASGIDPAAIDVETLKAVLTYHVVGAKVLSSGIPSNAEALSGDNLYFSLVDAGNFINGDIQIGQVDIESGSGVVHLVDKVIMPPSGNIVETAISLSEGGEFTSLIAALQRTADEGTPAQNLLTVLQGDGPFTIFAPTNAAFQALLDSNTEWSALNDIPLETLINVLLYHVVPARAYDKDLSGAIDANNELPTALTGQNLTVDLGGLKLNTNSSIVGVNTHASNGVIHVISSVLLP